MCIFFVCYSDVYALDPGHPATNNQLVCSIYLLFILQCRFVKGIILLSCFNDTGENIQFIIIVSNNGKDVSDVRDVNRLLIFQLSNFLIILVFVFQKAIIVTEMWKFVMSLFFSCNIMIWYGLVTYVRQQWNRARQSVKQQRDHVISGDRKIVKQKSFFRFLEFKITLKTDVQRNINKFI